MRRSFALGRVEQLPELGPQQALGWDRRTAHRGVQPVELPGHVAQDLVDQRANRAERMIGLNRLLGRRS
jgi:hypothetical protein